MCSALFPKGAGESAPSPAPTLLGRAANTIPRQLQRRKKMRIEQFLPDSGRIFEQRSALGPDLTSNVTRQIAIGLLLAVALLAFEIFNFDTTRYALTDLLGNASFSNVRW